MDAELKRRVEALRRPLELAAADGFAGVRTVRGLGHALRAACDGVLARIAADQRSPAIAGLDTWRATLGRWEQLDEQQQAIEVARGMRLLARLPRPAGPPPAATPTFTLPPLPAAPSGDAERAAEVRAVPVGGAEGAKPGAPRRSVASDVASGRPAAAQRREAGASARSAVESGTAPASAAPGRGNGATGAPRARDGGATRPSPALPGGPGAEAGRVAPGRRRDAARGGEDGDAGGAAARVPGAASRARPAAEPVEPVDPPGGFAPRPTGRAGGAPTPHLAPLDPPGGFAPRPTGRAGGAPTPHLAPLDPPGGFAPRPTGRAGGAPTPHLAPLDPPGGFAPRPTGRAGGAPTPHLAPLDPPGGFAPRPTGRAGGAPTPHLAPLDPPGGFAPRPTGRAGGAPTPHLAPLDPPGGFAPRPTGRAGGAPTPHLAPLDPPGGFAPRPTGRAGGAPTPHLAPLDPPGGFAPRPTGRAGGAPTPHLAPLDPPGGFAPRPTGRAGGAPTPHLAPLDPPGGFAPRPTGRAGGAPTPHLAPLDPLAAPTHSLPGIGPAFAEKLTEKGLTTVEDLVWLVPRRYDDVRDARPLAEVIGLPDGQRATFAARVASARMVFARGRRWAEVRLGSVERSETGGGDPDGSAGGAGGRGPPPLRGIDVMQPAIALVRWFNVFAGIDKRMPPGSRVTLSGVVRSRGGRLELANPDILAIELEAADAAADARRPPPAILARYPDVAGVPPGRLRAACAAACVRVAGCAEDGVPPVVEAAAGLPGLAETLAQLHAPPPDTSADDLAALNRGDSRWQRRLAFGELFALGVAITLRRRERRADAAVPCPRDPALAGALAAALPFALTGAQRRAIDEIAGDLARDAPMNRLLQGDVGAGKTAVAFAAALQAARAGRQTAVMAPTELLAEQHAETWRGWAKACGLRLELLTASTPRGVRASILALAAAGGLDVVLGTHALLAEAVGFAGLGLVVIDEQHRFGVAQRAKLRDKGDGQGAPHLLVMTATPIPRTLALTAYGDLDTSVLDELPPGRTPVATRLVAGARGTAAAHKLIAERVRAGERAYIVYPKVAPDEDADGDDSRSWKDATTGAAEVAAALPGVRVGLVHGRLDGAARDRVMRAFKAGELDALVATTVIEVGVDVPAATVMVIHDADRFGLAQLHQLRGRVGRGGGAAHCLLVSHGALSEDARRRLDAMVATHDGFRIAEEDLAVRGPGELLGPKQAGVPRLRFGNLEQHTALLLEARRHAEAVLEADPDLARPAHAALRRALARRMAHSVYGAESG